MTLGQPVHVKRRGESVLAVLESDWPNEKSVALIDVGCDVLKALT